MKTGDKVGVVCCSNSFAASDKEKLDKIGDTMQKLGLRPAFSDAVYRKGEFGYPSGQIRGKRLMDFYEDKEITTIFDISGGDIANDILPYLDFEKIKEADEEKMFWGYSDLTTVINAIYAKTGRPSVLYQIKHLALDTAKRQREDFQNAIQGREKGLFSFSYRFLQQHNMEGVVVGGNLRSLLKLAGTPYWPNMQGKILLLESLRGTVPLMMAHFNQLKQMGVLDQICGILLGTFTEMEEKRCAPSIVELVKQYVKPELPVAKTEEIGHGKDAKGIVIGRYMAFQDDCRL